MQAQQHVANSFPPQPIHTLKSEAIHTPVTMPFIQSNFMTASGLFFDNAVERLLSHLPFTEMCSLTHSGPRRSRFRSDVCGWLPHYFLCGLKQSRQTAKSSLSQEVTEGELSKPFWQT